MSATKVILAEIINLAEGPKMMQIVNAAARLALAERERCAIIAESAAIPGHSVQMPSCMEIAAKIREGKE